MNPTEMTLNVGVANEKFIDHVTYTHTHTHRQAALMAQLKQQMDVVKLHSCTDFVIEKLLWVVVVVVVAGYVRCEWLCCECVRVHESVN